MRHLRENVIYFTWCTTFLSQYLWYLRHLTIFMRYFVKKKNIAQKMPLQYFSVSWKTCDNCSSVYTAVSVTQGSNHLPATILFSRPFPSFGHLLATHMPEKRYKTLVCWAGNQLIDRFGLQTLHAYYATIVQTPILTSKYCESYLHLFVSNRTTNFHFLPIWGWGRRKGIFVPLFSTRAPLKSFSS